MPNFTFRRGREHKRTTFLFFPKLRNSPLEFNSKKIAKLDELNEMDFLSDVFVAVAVDGEGGGRGRGRGIPTLTKGKIVQQASV